MTINTQGERPNSYNVSLVSTPRQSDKNYFTPSPFQIDIYVGILPYPYNRFAKGVGCEKKEET